MAASHPANPPSSVKDLGYTPCLVAEVLSASTAATDTREKLQAYCAIENLHYYLLVESERAAVSYRIRGGEGEWLAAVLDPGERIEIECGPVRASLGLAEIYEDTGLTAA